MKFSYKGIDSFGKINEGVVEASSISEAEEKLTLQGLRNIKIKAITKEKAKGIRNLSLFQPKVKEKDLAIFTRQLGALISAGVGISEALEILAEQLPNKTLSSALKVVKEDVSSGQSLSVAMSKHKKVFPEFLINLISAAEESGNLDIILQRASQYYEKIAAIKRKIISASWYPAAVVFFATLIVFGILTFIVPTFAQLYEGFGSQLPYLTQIIVDISNFIKTKMHYIFLVVVGLVALNSFIYKTEKGKRFYHKLFLSLPLLGEIFRKGAIAKFARTLSTLVNGGVPIIRALEISAKVTGNKIIEEAVLKARDEVEKGKELYQSLDKNIFPPIFLAMIKVGENTGRLDEMLDTISNFFEDEVDRAVEGLLSLIEPMLIIFIGGIVGTIIVALYLPIFKIGDIIQK
ncbi:MAG: type II secretion system F family protein [Aquificae bacterium]|nr:type II secretion system F family protein [Aquificota bacterium]